MPLAASTEPSAANLRQLVLTAFETARSKGHPAWQTMNVGVFKNRLLQATGGRFDERHYGFASILELARSMPDVVSVNMLERPPTVTLVAPVDQVSTAALRSLGDRVQIRSDLWNAILNYSVGTPWVWTGRSAETGSDADKIESIHVMPTVTAAELAAWREEFLRDNGYHSQGALLPEQLDRWLATGAATYRLPPPIKHGWNAALKQRVLDRLTEFFESNGLDVPRDILTSGRFGDSDSRLGALGLRSFVEACVAEMTDVELGSLPIPAAVSARVSLRRSGPMNRPIERPA